MPDFRWPVYPCGVRLPQRDLLTEEEAPARALLALDRLGMALGASGRPGAPLGGDGPGLPPLGRPATYRTMLNLGPAEVLFILVAALLLLGPNRLPELARGLGRFFFEFRRQTEEVRGMVEREFYRMDQEARASQPLPGPPGAVARGPSAPGDGETSAAPPEPPTAAPSGGVPPGEPHG